MRHSDSLYGHFIPIIVAVTPMEARPARLGFIQGDRHGYFAHYDTQGRLEDIWNSLTLCTKTRKLSLGCKSL